MRIGVLALQGAVREHMRQIEACGHEAVAVKTVALLETLDGLVIPGGESTTLRRLMTLYGFRDALRTSSLPMYGTCAGLIVLAHDIEGEEGYLQKLDITVARNSFGRQVDSFEAMLDIEGIEQPVEGVFIRAPHIQSVRDGVTVLGAIDDKMIAVRQGRYLGVSFHPELTDDTTMMRYFIEQVIGS
ncbi:pyridoxal 5'-phosphate synthase glutaminase subunit PdxT [Staphylococcus americanisciuri]|uniref:Pyridoxal 5'-phosphate synthase subunit PdxT n=1 Tax=Staphylococcus americanisciuri TaxID=2973940 RepID=A0ABT2F2E8_9STAP|nr:pyridoxal 5'-phosphate synthase glutaminase subunit PdxT [Staphylococcus americanisciuri]MCS4486616.1 pyridoxal 5'-phosphate synthase glutaminase subunit PdxT [Staphylococcus americanisciuri]